LSCIQTHLLDCLCRNQWGTTLRGAACILPGGQLSTDLGVSINKDTTGLETTVTSREENKQPTGLLKNVDGDCDAKEKGESMESRLGKPCCWLSQGWIRTTPSSITALQFAKGNTFGAKSSVFVDETGCARFQGYDSIPSYQGDSVGPHFPIYSFHRKGGGEEKNDKVRLRNQTAVLLSESNPPHN